MKSLKNLITAPAEALLSTPEDPLVFQDTELAYSEMQQDTIWDRISLQQTYELSFGSGRYLTAGHPHSTNRVHYRNIGCQKR